MTVSDSSLHDLVVDHVEFYVNNATASAADLVDRYGFAVVAESGGRDRAADHYSVCLRQGRCTLVLTEAVGDDHPAGLYVQRHGDGVGNIALGTSDARAAFTTAVARGAHPIAEPTTWDGPDGFVTAAISGFGDVTHSLVQRPSGSPDGRFLPSFTAVGRGAGSATASGGADSGARGAGAAAPAPGGRVACSPPPNPGSGYARPGAQDRPSPKLSEVDHFAVCLEIGGLDPTVEFYCTALGFQVIFEERITVGAQAMLSRVVQSASQEVTLTLIQPDPTAEAGQIDDFIKDHGGPGVQHVAFKTADIVSAVSLLTSRDVEFLNTPGAYYRLLADRLDLARYEVADLRALGILVDEDHDGQLFQIFARSVHPRRTFFFEIIERLGAKTFGSGNIKALYEAVEAERINTQDVL